MHEDSDILEHLNVFNKLNTQLVNFDEKLEEEDKALLLLASLPVSYDHLVTNLIYVKTTLVLEEVTSYHASGFGTRRREGIRLANPI